MDGNQLMAHMELHNKPVDKWEVRSDVQTFPIADLVGKTFVHIRQIEDEAILFASSDGEVFQMRHHTDCCESVTINSITGDLQDLIGAPLLRVEEVTSAVAPEGVVHEYQPDSQTWTFYKFATRKGYVDIRWFGESNGYYSESVDFEIWRDS